MGDTSGGINWTDGKGIKVELTTGWLVAALENGEKLLMLPWFGNPSGALIAGAAVTTNANRARPRTVSRAFLMLFSIAKGLRCSLVILKDFHNLMLSVFGMICPQYRRNTQDRTVRT